MAHHSLSPPGAVGGLGNPPLPRPLLPKSRKTNVWHRGGSALTGLSASLPSQLLFPCALLPSWMLEIQAAPCHHTRPPGTALGLGWAMGDRREQREQGSAPSQNTSRALGVPAAFPGCAGLGGEQELWSRGWEALPPPLSCFPVIPQPCRAAATGGSAAQRGRGDIGESGWRHPGEMPCLAGSEHRPGGVGGPHLRAAPGAVLGSHTSPSTSSCFPWAARLEACEALQMSPATEGPPWSPPKAAGIRFCI